MCVMHNDVISDGLLLKQGPAYAGNTVVRPQFVFLVCFHFPFLQPHHTLLAVVNLLLNEWEVRFSHVTYTQMGEAGLGYCGPGAP